MIDKQVEEFFENYPNAVAVHEVATQLFHENAKDAAEARAKLYGLTVQMYHNPQSAMSKNTEGSSPKTENPNAKKVKKNG